SKRDAQGSNSLALMEQAGQGEINWAGAGGAGQDGAAADAPAGEGEGAAEEDASAGEEGALGSAEEGAAEKGEAAADKGKKKKVTDRPMLANSNLTLDGGGAAGGAGGGGAAGTSAALSGMLDKGNAKIKGGQSGKLSRIEQDNAKAQTTSASARNVRGRTVKRGRFSGGSSSRKLDSMRKSMGAASGESAETTYGAHNAEWAGSTGGGQALSGAGSDANFSPAEGGGGGSPYSPAGSSGGGYSGGYKDGYDDAGGGSGGGGTKIKGTNVTPYQQTYDMARALIALASAMLLIGTLFGLWAKATLKAATAAGVLPPAAAVLAAKAALLYKIAKFVCYVAMAAAAVATMCGLAIMMMGQTTQGAIITGSGALLTILAKVAADSHDEKATKAEKACEDAAKPKVEDVGDKLKTSQDVPAKDVPAKDVPVKETKAFDGSKLDQKFQQKQDIPSALS
ncbi:MAG: hypothetical protein ABIJ96_03430, partial [Elusimicrobiota bacterium]